MAQDCLTRNARSGGTECADSNGPLLCGRAVAVIIEVIPPCRHQRGSMRTIQSNGCPINVVVEGPENAPVLMLSNSLGTTHAMWQPQLEAFKQHFRLVRFDRRGHGGSGAPKGPYTMEEL